MKKSLHNLKRFQDHKVLALSNLLILYADAQKIVELVF